MSTEQNYKPENRLTVPMLDRDNDLLLAIRYKLELEDRERLSRAEIMRRGLRTLAKSLDIAVS